MPLLIAAIGQLFVILVGGLDLSAGSVISFTTAILSLDGPGGGVDPGRLRAGRLGGPDQRTGHHRMGVHPIIATLAMQYVLLGITRILRPTSGGTVPDIVISAVQGSFLGIPMPVIWGLVVIILAAKILYGSRFGLHLFCIGGGVAAGMEDAARNYGIRVERNIVLAYVACSCSQPLPGCFWQAASCQVIRTSAFCSSLMPSRRRPSVGRSCRAGWAACMARCWGPWSWRCWPTG